MLPGLLRHVSARATQLFLPNLERHSNGCVRGRRDMTMREGHTPLGADMSVDRGQQSPAEGAETPIWLATLPAAAPNGGMFQAGEMMESEWWG